MKSPNRRLTALYNAAILTFPLLFAPQFQVLASARPAAPAAPFDDPTWKALITLALFVNAGLYILVWRKRTN